MDTPSQASSNSQNSGSQTTPNVQGNVVPVAPVATVVAQAASSIPAAFPSAAATNSTPALTIEPAAHSKLIIGVLVLAVLAITGVLGYFVFPTPFYSVVGKYLGMTAPVESTEETSAVLESGEALKADSTNEADGNELNESDDEKSEQDDSQNEIPAQSEGNSEADVEQNDANPNASNYPTPDAGSTSSETSFDETDFIKREAELNKTGTSAATVETERSDEMRQIFEEKEIELQGGNGSSAVSDYPTAGAVKIPRPRE